MMTDLEKVIKGFECCQYSSKSHCDGCPYVYENLCNTNDCTADLASDALALLKEQEAVEPVESSIPGVLLCGACKCSVMREEGYRFRHCPWCGRKVKWE